MQKTRIDAEMRELELKIHYHFNDINWLSKAVKSVLIDLPGEGKNHKEYSNEGLTTVGDTILKSVIADKLYREGLKTKGKITAKKSDIENNASMHKMMIEEGLIDYSYNELHFYKDSNIPDHEKVVCKEHNPYVEAIIGAVFYDSNYDTTKRWILKWLLPTLNKYSLIR